MAGLYVHVPFCRSICPYCDFAVTLAGVPRRERFLDAVGIEARTWGERWTPAFDTVYFGGGTPSNLDPGGLEEVVVGLRTALPVSPDALWVLEANPEDVTDAAALRWAGMGFRSASLGVQSFASGTLRDLGRSHDPEAPARGVERLRAAGFDWVSLDLIFGGPDQTPADWADDLGRAVALTPDHLSCYQLTIHPGTVFGRRLAAGQRCEAPEEVQVDRFLQAHDVLTAAGFEHYEVSNYARPGRRSAHNQKYWRHEPYLGLGPSAHSFDGSRRRWWNVRKLRIWERRVAELGQSVEGEEILGDLDMALEIVMLGLRTSDGLDVAGLDRLTDGGFSAENCGRLERWEQEGLIRLEEGRVRPSARGMAVADALVRDLRLESSGSRS